MATITENLAMWNGHHDWPEQGEEWSVNWGGVSHQWWRMLFPRIQGYIPAPRILEIAPGYGRWTHFLKELCDELVIVDLAEATIEHCRKRFAADRHITGHVNDGLSLAMIDDGSIDFAFSFDSLVHVEDDVIYAYLVQLATKLTPDGVGFIHHSNMGAYNPLERATQTFGWRAGSVSAALVEAIADRVGLRCISQETLVWGTEFSLLNDCISVFTRRGSRFERDNVKVANHQFTDIEGRAALTLASLYPPSRRDVAFTAR